jgi:hypothetical protein
MSGFITVLIGHAYRPTQGVAGRFLYRCWARSYPTYWFWFLVTLVIYLSAPSWLTVAPD